MAATSPKYACKHLVLDAGPLLSLSPLRGLAETYVTVPQVLDELRDKRAREHFEKLALTAGVHVKIQSPDAESLAHVIQFAKKTGDYSVLSHPDLCVLALTYALDQQEKKLASQVSDEKPEGESTAQPGEGSQSGEGSPKDSERLIPKEEETTDTPAVQNEELTEPEGDSAREEAESVEQSEEIDDDGDEIGAGEISREGEGEGEDDLQEREPLDVELQLVDETEGGLSQSHPLSPPPEDVTPSSPSHPLYDDPSEEDDGEGEWITPSNVSLHKSRAVGLTPSASGSGKNKVKKTIPVGCMTADFAMQNVLLQMSLNLVSVEGKKIDRVKTWVLRCHACFKICKDSSKKFCPSCGNATLLRASVTISSPGASSDAPAMQVHLKKNFQHRTRGTIYSIPSPKPGSAKTGSGEGLILREDQTEFLRAQRRADTQRQRDEKKLLSGALRNGGEGRLNVGNWMDPDWIPDIISAGPSGKGRSTRGRNDIPVIGYGRKNPNERKHHK
ncbi:hypothetical protein BV25DRAFT_1903994 [Artomyces pyxidatus]|uniref:Uncharacterized protein n=1 Tax=Artomyces pyxidatus TaxID=48021 RepID=A0ACB8TJJ2_9AGAM|nr:hypothetical protein BV25DRAFT_1903994 [Artomyces pyxidatus]